MHTTHVTTLGSGDGVKLGCVPVVLALGSDACWPEVASTLRHNHESWSFKL